MEQTSYIIKLYLSANTTSQQELLRLLNLLLPKKMNKTILKQYQFSATGIDTESKMCIRDRLEPPQMRIGFQPAGAHIQMILYMLIHQFCHAPGDGAVFPAAVLMIHLKTSGLAVCAGVGVDGNGKVRLVSIALRCV